jgi:hypothetical protein
LSVTAPGRGRALSARLVGVGFFDKNHGQKEPAPNLIELHPVLSFTRATCSAG